MTFNTDGSRASLTQLIARAVDGEHYFTAVEAQRLGLYVLHLEHRLANERTPYQLRAEAA